MLSDKEMTDWSPKVGDRIEVVLSSFHTHGRGVLVARTETHRFVHCDGFPDWTGTFRPDQVRRERTAVDHLETAIYRFSKQDASKGWFWRRSKSEQERRDLALHGVYAITDYLRSQSVGAPNVADEIKELTEDGLRRGDRVNIRVREGGGSGVFTGTFIAEYKGKRHVIYDSGSPAAYPSEDVTKK